METTSKEDIQKILDDAQQYVENGDNLLKELDAMKEGKQFLLDQYKNHKHWFREEPGRVTVEDVIKMAFEFGWTSKSQFDYEQSKK